MRADLLRAEKRKMGGDVFDAVVILSSSLLLILSYLLVVYKDKSWINWWTPLFILTLGTEYIFQFIFVSYGGRGGTHYAYVFYYGTAGLSSLSAACVYAFVKPFRWKVSTLRAPQVMWLPWVLLALAWLFYLPVILEFREYLGDPRRIYELTRTGYGPWFFGSTMLTTVAFICRLFVHRKRFIGTLLFYFACALLSYWHGSKGEIVTCILIALLYPVYVKQKKFSALSASVLLGCVVAAGGASFALFIQFADAKELLESVTGYADYVRNAILVIDDENGHRYYGQLTLENEIYSRVPRALMPRKPRDYGPFRLTKTYDPAGYRKDEGAGAFSIGLQYADFGAWSMLWICFCAAIGAWIVGSLVQMLRERPSPGVFVVFLFMAGVPVIPVTNIFLLPETMLLAAILGLMQRFTILSVDGERERTAPPSLASGLP